MEQKAVTIQCQNLTCLAPNSLANKCCDKCGTPLVRRYLRMLGDWVKTYYRLEELVEDRYLVKAPQVVLDTKPVLAPQAPDEFPSYILPYLKLFPYRWHVPQVYGYIPTPDDRLDMSIWMLEYGTVPIDPSGELQDPDLIPPLTQFWPNATPIRQLYWIWQIAHLWQPFQERHVVSSLLEPSLLRVNGATVQILELAIDRDELDPIQLKQLAQVWSNWIPQSSPEIKNVLEGLCEDLASEKIQNTNQLKAIIDQALQYCAASQQRSYHLYTGTDTGTMREHNEDACYPTSGTALSFDEQKTTLAIVCDGIGGQEGGEIASQLAIKTLQSDLTHIFKNQSNWNWDYLTQTLNQSIGKANDAISRRNDQEKRQERRRMGTTLVMALAHQHQMYIGHVGDSRVYRITSQGCHQITVDDDLASREVRLGYLIYRDAIQYPNAGALVQALGMSSASSLNPTVQRYILDEDCIFLLCSDGLSDYDRVEQYWDSEIVPILTGEKTVAQVGQRLIEIANQKNGHDNSTIALFYCKVQNAINPIQPLNYEEITSKSRPKPVEIDPLATYDTEHDAEAASEFPTEPSFSVQPRVTSPVPLSTPVATPAPAVSPRQSSISPLLLGGLGLLLASLAGFYFWRTSFSTVEVESTPTPSISPAVLPLETLTSGQIVKTITEITLQSATTTDNVQVTASIPLPPNSVVKVIEPPSEQSNIVKLEVCSPVDLQSLQGTITIDGLQNAIVSPTPEEQNQCSIPTPSPSSSPSTN
ncbi:protein phosphatase [Aphanothece hegewaldii CCALA 016]|uniref:Protein phosphatase n=1 Tax=Aphanothece hegewaldii CCALA 016 TaxID=2107694 RepID=A0A2T1LXV4_9CHRO|nr:protein phosphatase 2C domain-containing protein [Aphanothece hegewaldii]PSF37212.1 protein phosphatase [Aphanothece hegewaldii CCALA 016]